MTAQGESREDILDNLDAVVAAVDGGEPPTDEEIQELGVEPEVARKATGCPMSWGSDGNTIFLR